MLQRLIKAWHRALAKGGVVEPPEVRLAVQEENAAKPPEETKSLVQQILEMEIPNETPELKAQMLEEFENTLRNTPAK